MPGAYEPAQQKPSVPTERSGPDSPSTSAEPWYAVWTRSRAEKAVHDQLASKDIEVFLPTVMRWSRWKDRSKQIDWPLFPGYCFARFESHDALKILTCTGVATIVSFDGKLAPIPDSEVSSIRRLVTSGLQYDPCPFIQEGDPVEVVHGPLTGVKGHLVKKGPRARLVLSVYLISRAVVVTVDAADIRKM
ncbi:MAG TPA: UpxY family transcription antiterminator [Vicinamibacterales bacterium]|jgi:transcription antitermination factor NusG